MLQYLSIQQSIFYMLIQIRLLAAIGILQILLYLYGINTNTIVNCLWDIILPYVIFLLITVKVTREIR